MRVCPNDDDYYNDECACIVRATYTSYNILLLLCTTDGGNSSSGDPSRRTDGLGAVKIKKGTYCILLIINSKRII